MPILIALLQPAFQSLIWIILDTVCTRWWWQVFCENPSGAEIQYFFETFFKKFIQGFGLKNVRFIILNLKVIQKLVNHTNDGYTYFHCQQSLVCSSFYDRAFVHYYYFICISNSGKPVCAIITVVVFIRSRLFHLFAFSIQGGRRFIQDQDRKGCSIRPRYGNALPSAR